MVQNKKFGFTLIELLVVISIIILFSGLSLAGYSKLNEENKLKSDTKKFESTVELVRKKAIVGDTGGCTGTISNYSIQYTSSQYMINISCNNGSLNNPIATYKLLSNVSIKTSGTITFPFQTNGVSSSSNLIFQNTNIPKCYKLTIQTSGIVDELGPSVSACN